MTVTDKELFEWVKANYQEDGILKHPEIGEVKVNYHPGHHELYITTAKGFGRTAYNLEGEKNAGG